MPGCPVAFALIAIPKSVIRTMPVVVNEDVGRLEIAMQDALGVGRRQSGAQLVRNLDDLFRRQAADSSQQACEVLPPVRTPSRRRPHRRLADVEHPAHRGVRDLAGKADLLDDVRARFRARRADQLQRDLGIQNQVVGTPDVAHTAAAGAGNHPVPPSNRSPAANDCLAGGGDEGGVRAGSSS